MASEPQPALLARKKLLKCSEESASGTQAGSRTLLSGNYYDVKCEPGDAFQEGERKPAGNYLGRVISVRGELTGTLSYKLDVAPGNGFIASLTGAGYASGHPGSDLSAHKTWSWDVYEDGRLKQLIGCACNITLDYEQGKKLVANYNWTGLWLPPTDSAMPSQAPVTAQPYICRTATLTVAAATIAKISKLSLDLGAAVEKREDVGASSGIAHFLVGEILPSGTFDPEARKVADQDQYGLWLAGGSAALSMALTSGTNTLTAAAPALQRMKITDAIRGARLVDEIAFNLCNSSGEDALTVSEA